ncbi:cutinase family protein [Gordonia otitidis]|uniref:cutinase family protein n=1 Tax=Gordonia otitidis TaxID=249058 RepID=UPI001D137230|nr:cutinase family protein [Gordonia otitidis]UEA60655.1 cutinase family protein [Gordonia otitidis]
MFAITMLASAVGAALVAAAPAAASTIAPFKALEGKITVEITDDGYLQVTGEGFRPGIGGPRECQLTVRNGFGYSTAARANVSASGTWFARHPDKLSTVYETGAWISCFLPDNSGGAQVVEYNNDTILRLKYDGQPLKVSSEAAGYVPTNPSPTPTPTPTPTTPTPTPGAPQTKKSCYNPNSGEELADIIYIGVRGSGQTSGMGEQVWNYYQQSLQPAAKRAGRTTVFKNIDYSSANVAAMLPNPAVYKGSYDAGLQVLRSKLRLIFNELIWASEKGVNCRNAKVVLGGYSQGALIVHRFLQDPTWLEESGHRLALGSYWGGAILFADPDQFRGDGLNKSPSSSLAMGIAQEFPGTGASRKKPTGAYASNSYSICVAGDVVCDYSLVKTVGTWAGPIAAPGLVAQLVAAGVAIHTSAYKSQASPPYYGVAAADLTRKVVANSAPK